MVGLLGVVVLRSRLSMWTTAASISVLGYTSSFSGAIFLDLERQSLICHGFHSLRSERHRFFAWLIERPVARLWLLVIHKSTDPSDHHSIHSSHQTTNIQSA